MSAPGRLERHYRLLVRCYPATWRRHHEDELVAVLLEQAEAEHRTAVSVSDVLDLVGHGAELRLDALLRWLPVLLRHQVAVAALVAGAALSLVLLGGEVVGARHRPPAEEAASYGGAFLSGPFLTIGVGLYLALMTAALLAVTGRGIAARLLLLVAVAYAAWLASPVSALGYPRPGLPVLVLVGGLALLAALATIRPGRRSARRMLAGGAGLVAAVALGVLLTRPFLGWSVGTMTTSGHVALAALATALPFVVATAMLMAASRRRRYPGWAAAVAVTALPVVLFCTRVSQVVNPVEAEARALIPACYLLVVAAIAVTSRRTSAQTVGGG